MKICLVTDVVSRWNIGRTSVGTCVALASFLNQYKTELVWCGIGAGGMFFIMMVVLLIIGRKKRRKAVVQKERSAKTDKKVSSAETDSVTIHSVMLTDQTDSMKTFRCDFKTTVIVGRNPHMCTLLIGGDNSISGRHCGIYVKTGIFYIKDLDSSNGTRVNGIPLSGECEIHTGDIVKLGRKEYLVELR